MQKARGAVIVLVGGNYLQKQFRTKIEFDERGERTG